MKLTDLNLQDLEDLHAALHACLYQRSQCSDDPSTDAEWHRLVNLDRRVRDEISRLTPNKQKR